MSDIEFEWDPAKSSVNRTKHGISFAEAATVFEDESALLISDPAHSESEDRFILLGASNRSNLLVVVHCYRESETIVRIVSARKATRRERSQYTQRCS
jgi:uncharacterized protein